MHHPFYDPHDVPLARPTALSHLDRWLLAAVYPGGWGGATREVLVPFFEAYCGATHLDVSVQRASCLTEVQWPERTSLTLLDWQQAGEDDDFRGPALRLPRHLPCEMLPTLSRDPFARYHAISAFNLLHRLPDHPHQRGQVVSLLATLLRPEGVLYGATLLGRGVRHTWLARQLNAHFQRRGCFHNEGDDLFSLQRLLRRRFDEVELEQQGSLALFTARHPVR